ncbi:MAG: pyruvate kinase [Planctomycetota bacterium]|nr:MAG: pyruvate kinase [Planctomycetota bacterium]
MELPGAPGRQHARTKIIATLGPASAAPSVLESLMRCGADAFRVNFSHTDHERAAQWVREIVRLRRELGRPVAILGDLRGPRLRLGRMPDTRSLVAGEQVTLVAAPGAEPPDIPVDYPDFAKDVQPGHRVRVRDGRAEMVVLRVAGSRALCQVTQGAEIDSNQGVNLPDTHVSAPILSERDRADIAFAVAHGLDWLAISFVRSARDVIEVRDEVRRRRGDLLVMAKVEHPQALDNLDEILEVSDAVMVARGDLAVEMGHERVPIAQKRIISRAIEKATPVVTATQMLESMIQQPEPTRAEVSDVANAVIDGTDAVMLSGETAVGLHPEASLRMMLRIVSATEAPLFDGAERLRPELRHQGRRGGAVEMATVNAGVTAAQGAAARLLLAFTETGHTAMLCSSFRFKLPIVGLTSNERSFHRMALYWGVLPVLMRKAHSSAEMYRRASETLQSLGWLQPQDRVVALTGTFSQSGHTNTVRLLQVEQLITES